MDTRSKAGRLSEAMRQVKDDSAPPSRKKRAPEKTTNPAESLDSSGTPKSLEQPEFLQSQESERVTTPQKSSDATIPIPESTNPKSRSSSAPMRQSRLNFGGSKAEPAAAKEPTGRAAAEPSNKRKRGLPSNDHPSVEKYAHLNQVADTIVPGLILVLVGNNPGVMTAEKGHPYSHPTNLFWRLLHWSGCTPRLLAPQEHRDLPSMFSMGQTNIVSRPTKDASELTKEEMVDGARILEEKFAHFRPEAVCIVGKGIWEAIWKWKYSKKLSKDDFKWGWQDERHNMGKVKGEFKGSMVFVATSTSGLAANLSREQKEEIWRPLGIFVQKRRIEREQESNPENQSS